MRRVLAFGCAAAACTCRSLYNMSPFAACRPSPPAGRRPAACRERQHGISVPADGHVQSQRTIHNGPRVPQIPPTFTPKTPAPSRVASFALRFAGSEQRQLRRSSTAIRGTRVAVCGIAVYFLPLRATPRVRRRSACSLMKPPASAWLYRPPSSSKLAMFLSYSE